jgi:hypothetical protein
MRATLLVLGGPLQFGNREACRSPPKMAWETATLPPLVRVLVFPDTLPKVYDVPGARMCF